MQEETFSAGVNPGGLTKYYEIKMIICYLLWKTNFPMSEEMLGEVMVRNGIANYFDFLITCKDLEQTGHIVLTQNKYNMSVYTLQELGKKTAVTFEKDLPIALRDKALICAEKIITRVKREHELIMKHIKAKDGYNLTITIPDVGSDLMSLTVNIPTEQECQKIKKRIINNPHLLYQGTMALLTGDLATFGDIQIEKEDLYD